MRLRNLAAALGALAASALAMPHAPAEEPTRAGSPPDSEDLLGNLVVTPTAERPLPRVGVLPSLSSDMEDVTLRSVLRRDLDLCGEFEVLPDAEAPEGLYLSDSPVDVKAWAQKGVEAVVKVSGRRSGRGNAELRAQAFLVRQGDAPVFEKRAVVPVRMCAWSRTASPIS